MFTGWAKGINLTLSYPRTQLTLRAHGLDGNGIYKSKIIVISYSKATSFTSEQEIKRLI